MDTFLFPLLLQVILIALNAIFACAEIAVISLNDSKIAKMAEEGNRRAKRLHHFVEQPSSFLSTIQIAITLSGFLGSAFAADNFSDILTDALLAAGVPLSAQVLNSISVVLITVILSYFTLIFGELVPKRLAMKKSEQLAMAMSAMLTLVAKIFAPIVWVLTISTNSILRLLGIDPNADDEEISEEEIQTMVDAGTRKGVFDVQEQQFIQNIFQFDDRTAEEFCTHRTEIAFLRKGDCMEKWENIIHTTRHSRYPICDDSLDHVIGILNVKDYFALQEKNYENVMAHAVHTPFYVPESVRADVLFRQMKQSHRHFAVVLDEYGGTAGVVTINDLLEQLVGELDDDPASVEDDHPIIEQVDANTWKIDGSADLSDVEQALNLTLPCDDYDTFGGLVFAQYGFIPEDGSTFSLDFERLHIEVLQIADHRLKSALVTVSEPSDEPL